MVCRLVEWTQLCTYFLSFVFDYPFGIFKLFLYLLKIQILRGELGSHKPV